VYVPDSAAIAAGGAGGVATGPLALMVARSSALTRSTTSERFGRLIDGKGASSMERKKHEGYF